MAVVGVVVMSGATPVAGAQSGTDGLEHLAGLLVNPARVHPDIVANVAVDLTATGSLAVEVRQARRDHADALEREAQARIEVSELTLREIRLQARLRLAVIERNEAGEALAAAQADVARFAVETFVLANAADLETFTLGVQARPTRTLAAATEALLVTTRDQAFDRNQTAEAAVAARLEELAEVLLDLAATTRRLDQALEDEVDAADRLKRLEPAFEHALMTAPVQGVDFPVVVLDAYYRAALQTQLDRPACGVRWDHLAGIGQVESRHGRYGGSTVDANGQTSGTILGPVLDGTQFASIPDTDGGRLDGDPVWDRAVGPMQFIPGSWRIYGADGNGDGVADPHNLYDAALAAARHLCGTTGGLGDDGNFRRALLGYNRSEAYGDQVMALAAGYRARISLQPGPNSFDAVGPGAGR